MATDPSPAAVTPCYAKAVEAYKKAVATAASVNAYVVLARSMAQELLPHDLRDAAAWVSSFLRARLEPRPTERCTIVIKGAAVDHHHYNGDNVLFEEVREYLATRINPRAMRRLCLSSRAGGAKKVLSMEPGGSMTDVFEGVEFTWASVAVEGRGGFGMESLEVSFDAEHTDMALGRYVPFITASVEEEWLRERALMIYMNESSSWCGITHRHPATFDTLAMDPALKQSIIDDLDRFLKRKEHFRRIGKAWKRGYLLYGPPGPGKSELVAAIANYLRFNLYNLDLSDVHSNMFLQRLLMAMSEKSILLIEDIDCCFSVASRQEGKDHAGDDHSTEDDGSGNISPPAPWSTRPQQQQKITLSGLLNVIDGLWSTSGEERIVIFTTTKRLDPALLRSGCIDREIYMGYCSWEAFKTMVHNYFLIDYHPMFPEIHELLEEVEATPAEVSDMMLRSEEADAALLDVTKFLAEKKQA